MVFVYGYFYFECSLTIGSFVVCENEAIPLSDSHFEKVSPLYQWCVIMNSYKNELASVSCLYDGVHC